MLRDLYEAYLRRSVDRRREFWRRIHRVTFAVWRWLWDRYEDTDRFTWQSSVTLSLVMLADKVDDWTMWRLSRAWRDDLDLLWENPYDETLVDLDDDLLSESEIYELLATEPRPLTVASGPVLVTDLDAGLYEGDLDAADLDFMGGAYNELLDNLSYDKETRMPSE